MIKSPEDFRSNDVDQKHFGSIMRTIAVANLSKLSELVFSSGAHLPPSFRLGALPGADLCGCPISFRTLTALDLRPCETSTWTPTMVNDAIIPILVQARSSLLDLSIEFDDPEVPGVRTLDPILKLKFPLLQSFAAISVDMSGQHLAKFIRDHKRLEHLSLPCAVIPQGEWIYVIDSLQRYAPNKKVFITGYNSRMKDILRLRPRQWKTGDWWQPSPVMEYIEGLVGWKQEWTKLFRQVPTQEWEHDSSGPAESAGAEDDGELSV